jgi:hypothetical protein
MDNLVNSCNNFVDTRLFQQVRYSRDITILLQTCVVNLVTFLLYHDCVRLVRTTSLIMPPSLLQVTRQVIQVWDIRPFSTSPVSYRNVPVMSMRSLKMDFRGLRVDSQSRSQNNACARARMASALEKLNFSCAVIGLTFINRTCRQRTRTPKFRGSGCQFAQSQCHPSPRTGIALGSRLVDSRIKIKSSSQVNFLAYYGSINQSTFTKF